MYVVDRYKKYFPILFLFGTHKMHVRGTKYEKKTLLF